MVKHRSRLARIRLKRTHPDRSRQRRRERVRLRRTHPPIPVLLKITGGAARGEIVRLAREGFYVRCEAALEKLRTVAAVIDPDGRALTVRVAVVRSAGSGEAPGFFVLISPPLAPYLELYEELLTGEP